MTNPIFWNNNGPEIIWNDYNPEISDVWPIFEIGALIVLYVSIKSLIEFACMIKPSFIKLYFYVFFYFGIYYAVI